MAFLGKVLFKTIYFNKLESSHVVKEDFNESSCSRVLGLCDSSQVESFYHYGLEQRPQSRVGKNCDSSRSL